jgi:hypothetical protein
MVDQNFANVGELVAYLQTLPQDLRVYFADRTMDEREITHVSVVENEEGDDLPAKYIILDSEFARSAP